MKKRIGLFLSFSAMACTAMAVSACHITNNVSQGEDNPLLEIETIPLEEHDDTKENKEIVVGSYVPSGEHNPSVIFVKPKSEKLDEVALKGVSYESFERVNGSKWFKISLSHHVTAEEAGQKLAAKNLFSAIDYDYIYQSNSDALINANPYADRQTYLDSCGIIDGWKQLQRSGISLGGSRDVVVAVIDTGVDYNHPDLRNNIWMNSAEIPGNGIDDDGNGYIDDIRGWDFYANDADPMDDHGHGTHVAGIVAAENNAIGTVGVAYNCRIMPLKASDSRGSFNTESVVSAIRYAYMNGASVINMSFGGSANSVLISEALADAYNQCVLVASAGNSDACNEPGCPSCERVSPTYPASLSYVIGVMSCNDLGTARSFFSNYDHYYFQGQSEYNVFAYGESIISTYPGKRYAAMSGTSMSAPIVSGIAALLRSNYPDRNTYSNKFISAQIVGTGHQKIGKYSVANVYDALNHVPTPEVRFSKHVVFDNESFSANNNGDGYVDAGETIHLGIDSFNLNGLAKNVRISLEYPGLDGSGDNPYVTIENPTITVPDIGTYSIGTGGAIVDSEGNTIDYENCFHLTVGGHCPHNIKLLFNVSYQYENGLDDSDKTTYTQFFQNAIEFSVSNGEVLSGTLEESRTLNANRKYIVRGLTIVEGATLTIEEGVELELKSTITSYGAVVCHGSEEKPIRFWNNYDDKKEFASYFMSWYGSVDLEYTRFEEIGLNGCNTNEENGVVHSIDHCWFDSSLSAPSTNVTNSFVYSLGYGTSEAVTEISGNKLGYLSLKQGNVSVRNNLINVLDLNSLMSWDSYSRYQNLEISNNVFEQVKYDERAWGTCYINGIGENNDFLKGKNYNGSTRGSVDSHGVPLVDLNDGLGQGDYTVLWPYVKSVKVLDSNGNETNVLGAGTQKFVAEFNTAIEDNGEFCLYFGSKYPFTDYKVTGHFVSDCVFEADYQVTASIEGGVQRISMRGVMVTAEADGWYHTLADDFHPTIYNGTIKKTFEIDVSQTLSMTLFANPTEEGVELTWVQDDYDTLMGYNIYRSTDKDGNYSKLNPCVIPAEEAIFLDDSAVPGQEYWYTFTVVLTDLSESAPAGKVSARAVDTIAPAIYHTPVNQGYEGNNLVVNCSISDNIAVSGATLYYRTTGANEWNSLPMAKTNDRFSATIFGSEVTLDGIEYYISATDGRNVITRGSEESPFSVVVKSSTSLNSLGDVDGDGAITTKDALMIIRAINDELILTDDQFQRADLNKDGILSTFEALRILQYINGNVTTLEM